MYAVIWDICFCTQTSAYEMRISDWSSDVCSSDLEVEAVVGSQLRVAVRDQRRLRRARALAQGEETGIARARRRERIAFEVELHPVLARDFRQRMHVVLAGMPCVRARVHGDAVRAGVQAGAGGAQDVGVVAAAGIAQHRDLVEVDAEDGHVRADQAAGGSPPSVAAARRACACSRRRCSSAGSRIRLSSRLWLPMRRASRPSTQATRKPSAASRQTTASAIDVDLSATANAASANSR